MEIKSSNSLKELLAVVSSFGWKGVFTILHLFYIFFKFHLEFYTLLILGKIDGKALASAMEDMMARSEWTKRASVVVTFSTRLTDHRRHCVCFSRQAFALFEGPACERHRPLRLTRSPHYGSVSNWIPYKSTLHTGKGFRRTRRFFDHGLHHI